jgi:hypothetical protein
VSKREEYIFALAKAEAARERLEAALANAEAALLNSVSDASKIDANRAEAAAKADRERADCRQLRAALAALNRSEFGAGPREWIDIPVRELRHVSKPIATASPPSIQSAEQTVRGEKQISHADSTERKPTQRTYIAIAAPVRGPKDVRANPSLVRHAIGLLALVLAYLAYFHADVQLQIVSLPWIMAFE